MWMLIALHTSDRTLWHLGQQGGPLAGSLKCWACRLLPLPPTYRPYHPFGPTGTAEIKCNPIWHIHCTTFASDRHCVIGALCYRPIQWQVALAPNIRKVAVVQTSLLTIHTYPQSSSSGDSSSDSEQEGGERHLELPVHFRKEPQSRLLAWCPQSRYLLLFTGSGCEKGKEDRGTASSESGDLLVLDTDQGEVLGTLSTASLLSTSPTSSSPSSPAASKPAKSTTRVGARAHQASQCVHLFCIDDVKGDTEEEEVEECGGACAVERKVLFQLCLVSAAGRLVVLSCALRSSHSIASLAEGCDESKRQQQPQQEQQREFQLSCTIMAVSTMSGAGAQRQGGEEEGCAVVVDAVA